MNKMKAWQGSYGVSSMEDYRKSSLLYLRTSKGSTVDSSTQDTLSKVYVPKLYTGIRWSKDRPEPGPSAMQEIPPPYAAPRRTSRHRPLPRRRRPENPGLHQRQGKAHRPPGRATAGHHPPSRDPGPGPQREAEALRRGVAGRRARTLGNQS